MPRPLRSRPTNVGTRRDLWLITSTASYDSTVPEYLAPGVFVEEASYRSKAIEGVATTGFGAFLFGILLGVFAALAIERARRRRRFPPS